MAACRPQFPSASLMHATSALRSPSTGLARSARPPQGSSEEISDLDLSEMRELINADPIYNYIE